MRKRTFWIPILNSHAVQSIVWEYCCLGRRLPFITLLYAHAGKNIWRMMQILCKAKTVHIDTTAFMYDVDFCPQDKRKLTFCLNHRPNVPTAFAVTIVCIQFIGWLMSSHCMLSIDLACLCSADCTPKPYTIVRIRNYGAETQRKYEFKPR